MGNGALRRNTGNPPGFVRKLKCYRQILYYVLGNEQADSRSNNTLVDVRNLLVDVSAGVVRGRFGVGVRFV